MDYERLHDEHRASREDPEQGTDGLSTPRIARHPL